MKNCIKSYYEKLKPLKSGFIENLFFENNRHPCSMDLDPIDHIGEHIGSWTFWLEIISNTLWFEWEKIRQQILKRL